ncbi:MAG: hypothetical protein M3Y58_20250 [Chloroflexota bacterium]|nr:hypothetical protein [Chloroflexota bacterium]
MRWIAIGLIVIGTLLLFVSLFADTLGIGAGGSDFGWKQVIGTTLGAGLCLGGARGWWGLSHTHGRGMEREG